jgi:hypothetical protein
MPGRRRSAARTSSTCPAAASISTYALACIPAPPEPIERYSVRSLRWTRSDHPTEGQAAEELCETDDAAERGGDGRAPSSSLYSCGQTDVPNRDARFQTLAGGCILISVGVISRRRTWVLQCAQPPRAAAPSLPGTLPVCQPHHGVPLHGAQDVTA